MGLCGQTKVQQGLMVGHPECEAHRAGTQSKHQAIPASKNHTVVEQIYIAQPSLPFDLAQNTALVFGDLWLVHTFLASDFLLMCISSWATHTHCNCQSNGTEARLLISEAYIDVQGQTSVSKRPTYGR